MELMDNNVTCECKGTIFKEILPFNIDDGDFRVYNSLSRLQANTRTAPIIECLRCGRYIVPSSSFAGRNRLDPDVVLYGVLLEAVNEHNTRVAESEATLETFKSLRDEVERVKASISSITPTEDVPKPRGKGRGRPRSNTEE